MTLAYLDDDCRSTSGSSATLTLDPDSPGYGTMDTIRGLFGRKTDLEEYEPLAEEATALEGSVVLVEETPFSWFEYGIFALLGMAMLWAW